MTTDFREDIKRERIDSHLPLFKKMIATSLKVDIDKIKVVKPGDGSKVPNIDRVVHFYRKNRPVHYLVECKTDDKTYKTGNIAIELITSMTAGQRGDIPIEKKIKRGTPEHKEALNLIEKVKRDDIKGNMGYGILNGVGLFENMFLSYLALNDEDEVHQYIVFKCKYLSEYVSKRYHKMSLFMTETKDPDTGNVWNTLGVLIPVEVFRKKQFAKIVVG